MDFSHIISFYNLRECKGIILMTLTQRRHVAVYRYAMVIMLYIISNYSAMPPPRGHIHDGNHLLKTGNGEKKKSLKWQISIVNAGVNMDVT